jgi:uncharacterized membrane protein YcaP (DUF421 family)
VRDGAIDEKVVRHLGLRPGDVLNAVRRQGANNLSEVESASIYPGGAIVVTLKAGGENATRDDIERLERLIERLRP